ncbi:MAG: histidine phosphatase family protein [Acidobacteriota bacterium]|nr:histidine phosphatase family protein [Acidobacteriota bacterium]
MKISISLFLGTLLFLFTVSNVSAQKNEVTVILLRHAEKDTSATADKVNPDLLPEGKARAQRLVEIIKKYKPDVIYSSDFIRTKSTVAPLAEKRKVPIQIYDHKKIDELAALIMNGKGKSIVVVGHNTSTPALANMLIKQEKYKTLDESEYGKIWIIKISKEKDKPDKIEEQVIEY